MKTVDKKKLEIISKYSGWDAKLLEGPHLKDAILSPNTMLLAMEEYASQKPEHMNAKLLANDYYEGCDGCTEFEEKMWKNGFVAGFHVRESFVKDKSEQ